jgi:hypothetical protein
LDGASHLPDLTCSEGDEHCHSTRDYYEVLKGDYQLGTPVT